MAAIANTPFKEISNPKVELGLPSDMLQRKVKAVVSAIKLFFLLCHVISHQAVRAVKLGTVQLLQTVVYPKGRVALFFCVPACRLQATGRSLL